MFCRRIRFIAFVILLALSAALTPEKGQAARAPELVERTFEFHGNSARNAAKVLGLDPMKPASLTLPWSRERAVRNCIWGPPPPAGTPPIRRCEDVPLPANRIEYRPSPAPSLRLTGSWLDEATGSGPRLSRFHLYSPKFNTDGSSPEEDLGGWPQLRATAKFPASTRENTPPNLELGISKTNGTFFHYISVDLEQPQETSRK